MLAQILLAVVSDVVWQAAIAAVVTIVIAWMQQRTQTAVTAATAKADEAAQAAATKVQQSAVKVEEVKQTLDNATQAAATKMDGLEKIATATHTLVNSNMEAQLKISAVALSRVAELTGNSDDQAAAELALKLLHEHEAKQASVDAAAELPAAPSFGNVQPSR